MRRLIPIVIVTAAFFAAPAWAGFYVGGSFLSNNAEFEAAVEEFDTDDSGWKIFVGWDIWKFFGLEASYRDLGTHADSSAAAALATDITAGDISARGVLPLGKVVELFGKVGYANIALDGNLEILQQDNRINESDWELMYGAGIGINLGKHFQIRGEWEVYDVETTLNSASLGAVIKF
jgi:hypothetical protein